jgi:membrane protease YdiL (CAAX protease family)
MQTGANLKLLVVLVLAVLGSTCMMLPAVMTQLDSPGIYTADPEFSFQSAVSVFVVTTMVSGLAAVFIGNSLQGRVGLGTPLLNAWCRGQADTVRRLARHLPNVLALGVSLGAMVFVIGYANRSHLPQLPPGVVIPSFWQGLLMMIGAAIREEILFRFGILNLIVWLFCMLSRHSTPSRLVVGAAITVTSVGFGALHVMPLSDAFELTWLGKVVGIGFGAAAGILLGWAYFRHGLLAAIVCHLGAGITLFVCVQFAISWGH